MTEQIEQIGKFKVTDKLGEGSFGVVYKGSDPHLKREVAIKLCSVEDEGLRKRFMREGQISGNLQHKNIVTVFAADADENGVPFLVQEFLAGEDLHDVIQRRERLTSQVKIDYLLQVARGLAHAHSQGVIHRDIKPANVRVLDDGTVKIMDFGIAKLASAETQLTQKGVTMGTASYLPPEQVRGGELDHRADIFSYGVLAYELLTYERPFRGNTLSALVYQILYKVPLPVSAVWSECPEALSELVARCLEKKPERRFASLEELIPELERICEGIEAGKWPALREVSSMQPAPPSAVEEEDSVLSESQISRTAVDLEGNLGDDTIAQSSAGGSSEPVSGPLDADATVQVDARAKTELLPSLPASSLVPSADATLATPPSGKIPPPQTQSPAVGSRAGVATSEEKAAKAPTQVIPQGGLESRAQQIGALIAKGDLKAAKKRLEETMTEGGSFPAPQSPPPPTLRGSSLPSSEVSASAPTVRLPMPPIPKAPPPPKAAQALSPPPPPAAVSEATPRKTSSGSGSADEKTARRPTSDLLAEISAERHPELARVPPPVGPSERQASAQGDGALAVWKEAFLSLPSWQQWGALAASGLLVVVLLLIAFGGREPPPPEPPPPEPPPVVPQRPTAVVPPAVGVVTVAALPWGEISEVNDSEGYLQELPDDPFTPLRIELPPGRYTLHLRHPDYIETLSCEVEVSVGLASACDVDFGRPTVTEFFKEGDWWP